MRELMRTTRVEFFKLKRTLALWAPLVIPLVVIAMTLVTNMSRVPGTRFVEDEPNSWDTLMLDQTLVLWCFVLLPLFVALEAALLAGVEHRENTWKHLFALPVRRWTIYASKLLVGMTLVCVTSLVLAAGTVFQGWLLEMLRPDLGLTKPIPWSLIFLRNLGFIPVVLLMFAVQLWVAIRWRSFAAAIGLGVVGTLVSVMLLRTLKNSLSTPYGPLVASLFPWSLPYLVIVPQTYTNLSGTTPVLVLRATALLVGIVGGLVMSVLGGWEILRRDVSQ